MANSKSFLEGLVAAHDLEGFADVFWNLGQLVAWVETRSPFPVDALSDSTSRLAKRDHSMPPGLPHFASEVAQRSADEHGLAVVKSPFNSIDQVRTTVLRAFQAGSLVASGQRLGSFEREVISQIEWVDLTLDDNLEGNMTVRHREGFRPAWTDVRVKSADVLALFPAPEAQSGQVRISSTRRGRAPKYDWDDAMSYALQLMDQRGDFQDPKNAVAGWRKQADLMALVIEYMSKHNGGEEPSESQVKAHLSDTLHKWRTGRK
ncbi:hypothetical protein [Bradyrhizobium yuanmingense]|uniref:hypothetical protein n=1 Tax=Bradyrhizobium yuanmingense TaxID=108015 RepID=UPI001CD6F0AB|nr:hypothetical protein [Bradyrhizobium yuanmingense]MCA1527340.1 hypothetical protein [Bradyrhizobium yuanmingense]